MCRRFRDLIRGLPNVWLAQSRRVTTQHLLLAALEPRGNAKAPEAFLFLTPTVAITAATYLNTENHPTARSRGVTLHALASDQHLCALRCVSRKRHQASPGLSLA